MNLVRLRSTSLVTACALAWVLAASAAVGPVIAGGDERVRVEDLVVRSSGDVAEVSYHLAGTIPDDIIERLGAGITITFQHRIDLLQKRSFFVMPWRTVHRCEIEATATYDSLTKQYALERAVRHRPSRGDPPEEIRETRTTESVDDIPGWIATVSGIEMPLTELRPTGGRARVKVESVLGRRYVLGMFPSAISAGAEFDLAP